MDFTEFRLTEHERLLRRMGLTHSFREASPQQTLPNQSPNASELLENKNTSIVIPQVLRLLFHGKHLPVQRVWTYAGMEDDLHAITPPARLEMLRKILAATVSILGWREEKQILWPCTAVKEVWLHGLAEARPEAVFCFGQAPILKALEASSDNYTPIVESSICIQPLPSIDAMAAGNQKLKNLAWNILKSYPA